MREAFYTIDEGLCSGLKNVMLDCGYRLDLVVENRVVVEIKSVTAFFPNPQGATTFLSEVVWL